MTPAQNARVLRESRVGWSWDDLYDHMIQLEAQIEAQKPVIEAAKSVRDLWQAPCTKENIEKCIHMETKLRAALDALEAAE